MSLLEKAQSNLDEKGITSKIDNGTLYVIISDVELELAEYEIEYQAKMWDEMDKEE